VVREVHAGGRPLSDNITAVLETRKTQALLTPRELDIVELIARGLRNREIAVTLGIAEDTAKVHVRNVLTKLKVRDRAAVIAVALRRGILHIS
jgi:DNA-binding NarL/FixJ family response regulator